MKQHITLSIDNELLKRGRALAAQRGTSVSAMLAGELRNIVAREKELHAFPARVQDMACVQEKVYLTP